MRILPEETCCVVVDIQEKFMPVIAEAEEMVSCCERLLRGLGILEIPVMVTAQYAKVKTYFQNFFRITSSPIQPFRLS